jgi:FkbH-like protein
MTMSPDPSVALAGLRGLVASRPAEAAAQLCALAPALKRPEFILGAADLVRQVAERDHRLPTRRLAVIGDVTLDGIAAAAVMALAEEGLIATRYVGPYGTLTQEVLDPGSGLYAAKPDIVLIAPVPQLEPDAGVRKDAAQWVEREVERWSELWAVLAQRLPGVRVIQHLPEYPDHDLAGPLERRTSWSPHGLTAALTEKLLADTPGFVHLLDMDRLAAQVGRANWRDPRLWFHGKVPFSLRYLGEYAAALTAAMRRATGRTRKALILDLDNTLWGGVVGDDGVAGIRLGPDTPAGEAYRAFCLYVKALGERGVILGICSKNDPKLALPVFESHPHMPLRKDDFAVIVCNWDDKASNLRRIASELNIDLSAIVFADDNEAECELIRRELPTVAVVPLTGDPSAFVRRLDQQRLFEAEALSAEDLKRRESYRGRQAAAAARTAAASFEDYLGSLEMKGMIWDAREEDIPRLAQMEGKTNQFNLTTRRWSADQLRQFMTAEDHELLCFRLTDRFADHGLVASVVLQYRDGETRILSWLMSCRVFSRTAEEFIMAEILRRAANRGAGHILGFYERTEKNEVVAGLLPRLGFAVDTGALRRETSAPLPRTFIADAAPADAPALSRSA